MYESNALEKLQDFFLFSFLSFHMLFLEVTYFDALKTKVCGTDLYRWGYVPLGTIGRKDW